MYSILLKTVSVTALLVVIGCSEPDTNDKPDTNNSLENGDLESEQTKQLNPLLVDWQGPYGGVPAFDEMDLAHIKPALETAMAANLAEIEAVADNPAPPTFENTILEMEKVGDALNRVFVYWRIWSANRSTSEFRAIQREMAPKLSAFSSKVTQNTKLFQKIKSVYEGENFSSLTSQQQRLVWLVYDGFASFGATLDGAAKKRYAEINEELAGLHTRFANNVLHDEEEYAIYFDEAEAGGLPDDFLAAAKAAAEAKPGPGAFAVRNTRSAMDPFLTYSDNRELRFHVWDMYYSRGDHGDEYDNNALIAEILKLRNERVQLLGFDNYAQWRLQNRMAKTPERAIDLMEAVWPAATARARQEVADMQAIADAEGAEITIEPWDYRYYAEKVRKAKYDLDSDEVKQYLELTKLRDAMFYVAGELFNFNFTPVPVGTVPVFHDDVNVWEVTDKRSGNQIGLWYLDPFARAGKRSGAWASSYRVHETFDGQKTVLSSNNSNFVKPATGEPVLISWSDAETFFHEFGHALHALSSTVTYPTLNSGVRDYTEFQSQLLERWLYTDAVINNFLLHHENGQPMPADLIAKIKAAATFNQGFATTEYLASALMDMRFHTADPDGIDPDAFERETLAELGMPKEIVMRHRSPHFSHIFSGEGYSAGYYGYMWADVLTSDAAEAFANAPGGFYDEELARKLVDNLFAIRNAMDPADAFRAFRGRDANIDALLRDRGFLVED